MKMVRIYALINPINAEYFYIGQTIQSLEMRLYMHLNSYSNSEKNRVIYKILRYGSKPLIKLLAEVRKEDANKVEKLLIKKYNRIYNLTNISHGKSIIQKCNRNKTLFDS
jgi:hypothetical protein